jgi:hypothetical protein
MCSRCGRGQEWYHFWDRNTLFPYLL